MAKKSLQVVGARGLSLPGTLTATAWKLPAQLTFDDWLECGRALDKIESGTAWWRGDWWIAGQHKYGERARAADESGLSFGRWANCGSICRTFETSRRREVLEFKHHEVVAAFPEREQEKWLDRAEREGWKANRLAAEIQRDRARAKTRQIDLDAAALGKFAVIYADPPWQYEHPPIGASNRSIENHYPTMTVEEICALKIGDIAHSDAVLFLWATSPKLIECMDVLRVWGFTCRSTAAWVKDMIGMGYYFREQHELLLVAKRGELPPPDPELRESSVINAPRMEHSAKPPIVRDMLDRMYPKIRKLELFSRETRSRELWTFWGNQVGEQPQLEAAE